MNLRDSHATWVKLDVLRIYLYYFLSIISLGIVPLYCYFNPSARLRIQTKSCRPCDADYVEFSSRDPIHPSSRFHSKFVAANHHVSKSSGDRIISFECKCKRYYALKSEDYIVCLVPESAVNEDAVIHFLKKLRQSNQEIEESRNFLLTQYGSNQMVLPNADGLKIFLSHLISPFYLFQYFATTVWLLEGYILYSVLILLITLSAVVMTTRETLYNLDSLRKLTGETHNIRRVVSNMEEDEACIESGTKVFTLKLEPDTSLAPVDLFVIEVGMTMPCDAILLVGNVVVDESMLTGESIPVSKSSIDPTDSRLACTTVSDNKCPNDEHSFVKLSSNELNFATQFPGNVLFAGTRVKACNVSSSSDFGTSCIGLCYRTGFRSARGQLVASLLAPRDESMSFFSDSLTVIAFMFLLTIGLYVIVAFKLKSMGTSYYGIFLRFFDAITIAVPPALTACLTMATTISVDRLKECGIFVSDTNRVNWAGSISAACFDKTGTLTEDKLVFQGIYLACRHTSTSHPTVNSHFQSGICHDDCPTEGRSRVDLVDGRGAGVAEDILRLVQVDASMVAGSSQDCIELMATCHSLAIVEGEAEPCGDPLEVELFRMTGWQLAHRQGRLFATPPILDTTPHTHHITLSVSKNPLPARRLESLSVSEIGSSNMKESERMVSTLTPTENASSRCAPSSACGYESSEYEILRHFEFTPEKLRSASLLQRPSGEVVYLIKGSPEVIMALCSPSTLPRNLNNELTRLAKNGLRVIAMAMRNCSSIGSSSADSDEKIPGDEMKKFSQLELESRCDLQFLGLLCLSSSLKSDASETIRRLSQAEIHTAMITGDHIHTAVAVAKDCGIVRFGAGNSTMVNAHISRPYQRVPSHGINNTLYIVDGDEAGERVIIIDSQTEAIVQIPLERMFDMAALSSASLFVNSYVRKQRKNGSFWSLFTSTGHSSYKDSMSTPDRFDLISAGEDAPLLGGDKRKHGNEKETMVNAPSFEIAVTGKGLHAVIDNYPQQTVDALVRYAKVFARTKPADKKFVVETLMRIDEFDERLARLCAGVRPASSPSLSPSAPEEEEEEEGEESRERAVTVDDLRASLDSHRDDDCVAVTVTEQSIDRFKVATSDSNTKVRGHDEGELTRRKMPPPDEDQDYGKFQVLFCGDGANDMSALRAATVGVSLCDAETSVAAPITSKLPSPSSVVHVIRQGRCSLVTAYVLVLFNIMYGLIQLFMCCQLYGYGLIAGNYMYLIQDMFYTLVLGIVISMNPASDQLSPELPPKGFFNRFIVSKLMSQLLCFTIFQIISLQLLSMQSFYTRYTPAEPLTETYSYEATTIDCVALGQLMIASIVSTIGEPFRYSWYRNRFHVAVLLAQTAWLLIQIFAPYNDFTSSLLSIKPLPTSFGVQLACLIVFNGMVSCILSWLCDSLKAADRASRYGDLHLLPSDFLLSLVSSATNTRNVVIAPVQ